MSQETTSPQAVFDQAIAAYNSQDYGGAIDLLKAVLESGVTSADLELNLSKAYLKTGKLGDALLHAERGVFLDRWNMKARDDLKVIQRTLPGGYGEVLDHPAELSWKVHSFVRGSEALFIGVFLVFLALFHALLRMDFKGRTTLALALSGFFFLLLSAATLPARSLGILQAESELRSTPIASAESTLTLPAGTRVRIRQESGNFVEVERPNGFRGWIAKSSLQRLLDTKKSAEQAATKSPETSESPSVQN
jgi:hypothetical protein